MIDTCIPGTFILFALILLAVVLREWWKTRNHWYALPAVLYLLAALSFFEDWNQGIFGIIVGGIAQTIIRIARRRGKSD